MAVMATIPAALRRPWPWAVAFIVLAGYAAAGFWLVPRLITNGVRDFVATHYHRAAQVGQVSFNPFTLELGIHDVALPDADGGPLLSFKRLYVHIGAVSLLRLAPEFKTISLDAPRVRVVRRADGRINLLELSLPPDPKADPNAPPPRLWIDEFAMRGGEATIIDQTRPKPLTMTLQPITFTLNNFSTRSEGNAYAFVARSVRGEGIDWRGTFGLAPLASKGTFALKGVKVQTLTDIGGSQIPFQLSAGELDLHGDYDLAEHGQTLAITAGIAELTLRALGIRLPGESTDAIVIPRLAVTDTKFDLEAQTLVVGHVLVEQPHVNVVRGKDGMLNVAQLAGSASPPATAPAPAAPATAATAPATAAKPWTVSVPDIRVAAGDIAIEDRIPTRAAAFHLAAIDLTVGSYAQPAKGPLDIDLKFAVNDTGQATVAGKLSQAPLAGRFTVALTALPLPLLQPYFDDLTSMTINSGTASAKGDVVLAANGAVSFDGGGSVDSLATIDQAFGMDFIKWQSLQLAGLHAQTAPLKVSIKNIDVRDPYARVIIEATGITNLKAVLAPHSAGALAAAAAATPAATTASAAPAIPAAAVPAGPPPKPLPIEIGLIKINGGSANFADLSIKPNFQTGIQQLSGTIKSVSGKPESRADIDLAGQVDRYAPVTITGQMSFLGAIGYTNVKIGFKNVELTGLSPYSGRFAGYRIERGKLSAEFSYLVQNRKLQAKHHFVVDQLELGDRVESPDATGLPVKFAISLLKDRNGVIDLDVPVNGSLDDPQFSLSGVIWKVIVNIIEKAITAPFSLLGSLFGGGEEVSYIDFAPGSAVVDAAAKVKLQLLAKGLDARPALKVDVPLFVAPEADSQGLVELRWQEWRATRARARLGARGSDPAAVDALLASPKDYRGLLEDSYRAAFGHRAELPKPAAGEAPPADPQAAAVSWLEAALKARLAVGQPDLDELAQARATAVQAALLEGTGIDPERVFIVTEKQIKGSGPVRMQLEMH